MWLFVPFGFFSVVAHREHPDVLLVRARARSDLAMLLSKMNSRSAIEASPDADYPYRVSLLREEVEAVLAEFIREGLQYDNFKNACMAHKPASLEWPELHDVWETMRRHEDGLARPTRRRAPPGMTAYTTLDMFLRDIAGPEDGVLDPPHVVPGPNHQDQPRLEGRKGPRRRATRGRKGRHQQR